MSGRKRFIFLLAIMALAVAGAGSITLVVLYDAAFEEESERLIETAASRARLIEAVARFDQLHDHSADYGGAFEATLSQLKEAHSQFRGFGETGEFTLAKLEGDSINFLLSHRHHDVENPHPVSFRGDDAEPMRRALLGKSGTVVGLDYRGVMVLAAHEPVAVLNLGIVAKIDLAEIRAPFIRAGILASCIAGVLVLFGAILFVRVGMPLVNSLEESEKKYRQLFCAESDAILVFDTSTFKFIEVNQAAIDLYGYDLDEFLNLEYLTISAEPEKSLAVATKARNGDIDKIIHRDHKKKDGTVFPVEISVGSFTLGSRRILCSIVRDVTERKKAEQELKDSEQRFSTLVESAPMAIYETDAHGKCLYVNEKWRELAGLTLEEALGYGWQEGLHKEDRAHLFQLWSEHSQNHEPWDMEYRFCTPDGKVSWVMGRATAMRDEDGRVTGYLGANVDITERKRAEESLRLSEEKHRILVEQMNEGLGMIDAAGRISFANDALCKMLGRSLNDLMGLALENLVDDVNRHVVKEQILTLREHGVSQDEIQWTRPDGRQVPTMVSARGLPSADGTFQGAIVVVTDISARIESELALRESESKYRAIIDFALDAIVLIDIETGQFVQFNSEAYENLGYSRDEFRGLTIADVDATESPDEVSTHIDTVLREGSDKFETQMRTKTGELKDVLVSVTSIWLQGRQYLSSMWRDVTIQMQAEKMRCQQHEFLQTVIDSLGHPLSVISTADHTIKLANAAYKAQKGYEDGITCHQLVHGSRVPCDGITHPCPLSQVVATGKPATVEHQHIDRDGEPTHSQVSAFPIFDGEGNVSEVIEYAVDITERKLAEVALRESEARYRRVVEETADLITKVNSEGTFTFVNHVSKRVFGLDRNQCIGLSAFDFLHADDRVRTQKWFQKCIAENVRQADTENRQVNRETAAVTDMLWTCSFHYSDEGELQSVDAIARDITERKTAEVALNASLKEKETLLKEIHHRVKNNLQVISSLLRIQSGYTDDHEIISVLEASQGRVNSMALIHEQLYQSSNLAEIDFTEYVQNLAEQMLTSYGVSSERITLEYSLRDVLLSIDTAIPCGLIVTELLSNALKHAFPDGRTGRIHISHYSDGNQCTLTVSDTGVGIPPEVDWEHSPSLGLQLVGLLAKQLGGSIEMKSDKGISFSLVYPQETTSADDSSAREVALENA